MASRWRFHIHPDFASDGSLTDTAAVTISVGAPTSYTLTVNVIGNGTVSRSPSATTYISGTVVHLTALPIGNWVFTGWRGDLCGTPNPAMLLMDADRAVTATFSQSAILIYLPFVYKGFRAYRP